MQKLGLTASLLQNRLNLFYILAFAPLPLIQYFGYVARRDYFGAFIPLYGFLLLLIKKDKLSVFAKPSRAQQLLGLILITASFFLYYAVAFFYPQAQFYGVTNYTIYIVGLFLFSFQTSALKQSFAPLFLIVAPISSGFLGEWMEFHLEPWIPHFVQIMAFVLKVLNIPAELHNPNTFIVQTQEGLSLPLGVVAGCIGINSFLAFAIIISVTMIEDTSSPRTKLLWSVAGIIGTFFVNLIRVSLIFVVIHYYGYQGWGKIHTPIGYVLFIVWLAIFFIAFSTRQIILDKLQTSWRKIR